MWFKQIHPNLTKGYSQKYICADYVWNQEEKYRILCSEAGTSRNHMWRMLTWPTTYLTWARSVSGSVQHIGLSSGEIGLTFVSSSLQHLSSVEMYTSRVLQHIFRGGICVYQLAYKRVLFTVWLLFKCYLPQHWHHQNDLFIKTGLKWCEPF